MLNKYKVIEKHTLNYKVGDVIELTESKAVGLKGKVELMPVEVKVEAPKKTKKATK